MQNTRNTGRNSGSCKGVSMDINNISSIDMSSLSTEQAYELGLNSIFLEDDGTYNWIYCMKMRQDLSMFKFIFKIVSAMYALMVIIILLLIHGSGDVLELLGIFALCYAVIVLVIIFSYWLIDKIFKGNYMLIFEMNEEGITFSQTTDQAEMTRMIAATSAAVNLAGNNVGGVIAGTGMAFRPNSYHADFSKVMSVKGKREENLIWVNTLAQFLQVYVPSDAYEFVWQYITQRCVKARIS